MNFALAQLARELGFEEDDEPQEQENPAEIVDQETGEIITDAPPVEVMTASLVVIGERTLGDYSDEELQAVLDNKKAAKSLRDNAEILAKYRAAQS